MSSNNGVRGVLSDALPLCGSCDNNNVDEIQSVGRDQAPAVGMYYENEDQRLTNFFGVHPRSIAAYEEFCDVVIVDTTYLVNHYRMSFASIIRINDYEQSILLGSALISHEDSKSFKWIFSMWLAAMRGRAPYAIMTDQ
ncbi:protein FAR-RED ELONGATED HYPOCOTYL 3-like [Manihot esculenta]|uniref:protein FAR-RED ELONGATED HYPOCOTYL 3-like n=1 Tax=Manihot esculenta TaxID=3983 RepID=UPI000B5D3B3C|nr:protein FAR-RED ELONGATED HYPOCOTYL 3-like [Manihot esculenta]